MKKNTGFRAATIDPEAIQPDRIENLGPLVIHRPLSYNGVSNSGWVVSHEQTGYRLFEFNTLYEARKFARLVEKLDWDFTDPKDKAKLDALKTPVLDARRAVLYGAA